MNVIRAEEVDDEQRAKAIVGQYHDKDFSYCDALNFAVMERLEIQEAIAFDDYFRQYGQFTTSNVPWRRKGDEGGKTRWHGRKSSRSSR